MRVLHHLDFVFALRRDGLLDAIQARFHLFIVALRGGLSVLSGLLQGTGVGGGVLAGLLDLPQHGLLLFLKLLVRLNDVPG